MFNRRTLYIAVLVAGVAVPFVMMNGGMNDGGTSKRGAAGIWDSMLGRAKKASGYDPLFPSASPIPSYDQRTGKLSPWSYQLPTESDRRPPATDPYNAPRGQAATNPHANMAAVQTSPGSTPARSGAANGSLGGAFPPGDMADVGARQPAAPEPHLQNVHDLFRFNITPQWIVENWPRVTSQLAEFSFTGMRIPVITGTDLQDVAGSITYYFDSRQQLQRIMFLGTTGDPRQLTQLATSRFKMEPQPALDGICFVSRTEGDVTDLLRVRHAPIVNGQRPHQRYRVVMELNRPGNPLGLSAGNILMLQEEREILSRHPAAAKKE
jgi:hypothetical protein